MQVKPFTADLLPAAAELLALRHQRQRAVEPLLPERFGQAAEAHKALAAIWSKEDTTGVAAFDGDQLVGYLLATAEADIYRGHHAWVNLAGHAISVLRPPASLRTAANRPRDLPVTGPVPAGITIRQAGPGDLEFMLGVAGVISEYQTASPCFAYTPPEDKESWREDWAEQSDSDMLTGENACYLEVAATWPEARGRGLGLILTAQGLAEASKAGYSRCITDWRMTNLFSSRFWPRQGFAPAAYRIFRAVDPRCGPG